jgi:tRNA A-37 threonylcarbamoyl transferase component Bud32
LTACPGREQLLAFHLGKLPREALDALAVHLDACQPCSAVIEELQGIADYLLEALVEPLPPDPVSESEARRVAILLEEFGGEPTRPADVTPLPADGPGDGSAPPLPGGRLGQYELLERLGAGAMGQVFKARHPLMGRVVAVKVLRPHCLRHPEAAPRFVREIRALARLDHPNIVRAHDAGQAGATLFLVMEYVEGVTLDRLVRERGPLPLAQACDYVRQAALGLQHAFEHGMVHRDVKPANLILTPAGQVKVLDLGLALLREGPCAAARQTVAGQVLGTLEYMAPEHGADARGVDIRADVYSLGCTLYDLLAGRPPFSGPGYASIPRLLKAHAEAPVPPIRQYRPDVPDGLVAVLERMLAKDPARRYATPAEVAEALRPFAVPGPCGQQAAAPAPQAAPAAVPARGRRWPRPALLAAAAVLFVLLTGALWWGLAPRPTAPRITIFQIDYYRSAAGGQPRRQGGIGRIGLTGPGVRSGDGLRVRAKFSEPAYWSLIALPPSGNAFVYPTGPGTPSVATTSLEYPPAVGEVVELQDPDRTGLFAFVLVASARSLPPFEEGRTGVDPEEWRRCDDQTVWRFDDRHFEALGGTRLKVVGGPPQPLEDVCRFFKTSPGVDAVEILAFPVKPKE